MLNLVVLKRFGIFAILFFDIVAGDSHENFLSNFLSSDEGDNYSGQEMSPYLSDAKCKAHCHTTYVCACLQ